MATKDLHSSVAIRRAISPVSVADNTAQVSQIIDTAGFESVEFAIATGGIADVDATFAVSLTHGDDAALADGAAVAAADLLGTVAEAGFTFADDDKVRKIGYRGAKRYVRLTITPANNAGAALLSAVAVLAHARHQPVA